MLQSLRKFIQLIGVLLVTLGLLLNLKVTIYIILISSLIFGPFYCGWICPFGFIQDISRIISRKYKIKQIKITSTFQLLLKSLRYILYLVTSIFTLNFVLIFLRYDSKTALDSLLTSEVPSILAVMILFTFILSSLFIDRVYCNYFCITGAKYGLLSYFRMFTIQRNEKTCVDCKACDNSCPMDIKISTADEIRSTQCINCFNCISACPIDNTMKYKPINIKTNKKKFIIGFIVLLLLAGYYLKTSNTEANSLNTDNTEQVSEETIEHISTETDTESSDIVLGAFYEISDGVYTGSGMGFRGELIVDVTIKNGYITNVEVISHREDRKWFNAANCTIPTTIIDRQSTDIDVVSGATYSSIGIIEGVNDALENAE